MDEGERTFFRVVRKAIAAELKYIAGSNKNLPEELALIQVLPRVIVAVEQAGVEATDSYPRELWPQIIGAVFSQFCEMYNWLGPRQNGDVVN